MNQEDKSTEVELYRAEGYIVEACDPHMEVWLEDPLKGVQADALRFATGKYYSGRENNFT